MGRYSNPDNVARLRRVLSSHQGRDRASRRPVSSLRRRQVCLGVSQRAELVERYLAGESSNALALECGVDRGTATGVIRKAGIALRHRADVNVDAASVLYESDFSLVEVGEQPGVSSGTILNLLRRAGVPTRHAGTNQRSERGVMPPAG